MGAAYFYHLTQSSVEQTLPMLLTKSREQGWTVDVRGTDQGAMARLDQALWLGPPDAFLPHGLAGGPHDFDQPVLLTTKAGHMPHADCVMSVHRADISPEEVTARARVCILFDGHDGEALAHARVQWKTLTAAGCSAQYWAQDGGRWEKKAEA